MTLNPEWIGSLAGVMTTLCYVPQVWRSYKTKQVEGISLGMYAVLTLGVALWLVYGIMIGSMPLAVSNSLALTMIVMILIMRIRYYR